MPCQIRHHQLLHRFNGLFAGDGYDLVTGSDPVDAYNLVTAWAQPQGTTLSVASSHTGEPHQGNWSDLYGHGFQ